MQPHIDPFIPLIIQQTNQIFNKKYFDKFKKQPEPDSTVICSISLANKINKQSKVASVGFGTKSIPYSTAVAYKGKIIIDMHAQILARRGFLHFLIENLPKAQQENQIFAWDNIKLKHHLRPQYTVILYANQIFCGDCMTNELMGLYSGARPLKYFATKQVPQQQFLQHCLRTKPGRMDLPLDKRSLSLSCSDKIGIWNILGIQGKKLFNYLKPIYIDMIIIETGHKIQSTRIREGINLPHRISKLFQLPGQKIFNKLFNIMIDGKMRPISNQFKHSSPKVIVIHKEHKQQNKDDKKEGKKLDLCGIFSADKVNWLSGRTGLPEGVGLNKINKTSEFCSLKLYSNLKSNEKQEFKYHAIKQRIKLLFQQWTDDFKNIK